MSKRGKARFGLTMSHELLERIEEKRGLIPRATYIEHCLKQYFDLQNFKEDEVIFYDEILAMLPEKMAREDYDKLRIVVESVRSKILERKRLILPK